MKKRVVCSDAGMIKPDRRGNIVAILLIILVLIMFFWCVVAAFEVYSGTGSIGMVILSLSLLLIASIAAWSIRGDI